MKIYNPKTAYKNIPEYRIKLITEQLMGYFKNETIKERNKFLINYKNENNIKKRELRKNK